MMCIVQIPLQVWNVSVVTTEEYPHLRPDHLRRGFIYRGIRVRKRREEGGGREGERDKSEEEEGGGRGGGEG